MNGDRGEDRKQPDESTKKIWRILTIAIPTFSFGGILVAIVLAQAGLIPDAGEFGWGCAIGGFLLGYLAYTKPRRDIVSLLAPVYSVLIFVFPLEIRPNLLLQVLFAISITALMVRLNLRFSTPPITQGVTDPMEEFYYQYLERLRPMYRGLNAKAAHEIASAVLSFKFGLYTKASESVDRTLPLIGSTEADSVLKKALFIVKERADRLHAADVAPVTATPFAGPDFMYLAVVLPPEKIEDKDTLLLDNALILLFAVAYIASPADEQALEEQEKFVIQTLNEYRRAMESQG